MISEINGLRVLTPDMLPYLTKSGIYCKSVTLSPRASQGDWREASQEDYDAYLASLPDPREQDIPAEEALKIIAGGEPDDV